MEQTSCCDNEKILTGDTSCQENLNEQTEELLGEHETQVCMNGEAGLNRHRVDCTKNPGHTNFIPAEAFTLQHLPEGYQDNDLFELVKEVADLTVRIDVKMTSPDRPEFWPDSNVPYPCVNLRDSNTLRTGSGRMRSVIKYVNGYNKYEGKHKKNFTECQCLKCQQPGSRSTTWWEIELMTATSVVFDNIEARETSCRLFYDREDSPVVTLDKINVDNVNIAEDRSLLICVTCDMVLMDKLAKMLERFDELLWKVHDKYKACRDADKLTFIASHPHGCPKQISIGHWKAKYQVGVFKFKNRFTYTTSTCPGCTGAPVYILGYSWWGRWWSQHVHSVRLVSGLGCSGVGDVL